MRIDIKGRVFVAHRIFCIGKNYGEHVKELGGNLPEEPVVFMKPASSLVASNQAIQCPPYGSELHHEVEVVLLIGKGGKGIQEDDAYSYISGVTIGLDLTLRDVQKKLKKGGLPWELSKSFDQSAPIGIFKAFDSESIDLENLQFTCHVNGDLRQDGNTRDMIFPIKNIIKTLSSWWMLQPGDIIYTGTPSGVGPLLPGDEIGISSPEIGSYNWNIAEKN
jgi:2-keto-4-pentenoate hydratase/2-oxohepta-3-ene-1,7-dioic acid hydratase in catechol pathway